MTEKNFVKAIEGVVSIRLKQKELDKQLDKLEYALTWEEIKKKYGKKEGEVLNFLFFYKTKVVQAWLIDITQNPVKVCFFHVKNQHTLTCLTPLEFFKNTRPLEEVVENEN